MELSITETTFCKEIHEKLTKDFDEFKHYQEIVINTLKAFHEICEKRDIDYYLAYGSLLGAVRDKGQIPWDYDVDLWIKYEDLSRLLLALDEDLPNDFYYVTRFKDNNCYHFMLRIAPKGFRSEVLHVDVFWLFGAPMDPDKLKKMCRLYKKARLWGESKNCDPKYFEWQERKVQTIYYRIKKFIFGFVPNSYIDSLYFKALSLSENKSSFYSDQYGILFNKKCFAQKEKIIVSNGMMLNVPNGRDEILKSLYGNYQSYLSIEERFNEFKTSLARIRKLGKDINL